MAESVDPKRYVINQKQLPPGFPTHLHSAAFWEALGRAVATFGFLEETLGKAIFAFTATRRIPEDQLEAEYKKWVSTLEKALTDALGSLIASYDKAVRANADATIKNLDELVSDLRAAKDLRNVICHGSWRSPDDEGRSLPLFVDRELRKFDTPIDVAFLVQLQQHVTELVCAVINTVTHMGLQFPGSMGPGIPILSSSSQLRK